MSKFKVGDRVEVSGAESVYAPGRLNGCVGVVTLVRGNGDEVDYYVSCDGEPDNWCFGEDNLRHHCDLTTLTRRDHFAMAALTGLLSSGDIDIKQTITGLDISGAVAMLAYEFASAMETARNKEGAE